MYTVLSTTGYRTSNHRLQSRNPTTEPPIQKKKKWQTHKTPFDTKFICHHPFLGFTDKIKTEKKKVDDLFSRHLFLIEKKPSREDRYQIQTLISSFSFSVVELVRPCLGFYFPIFVKGVEPLLEVYTKMAAVIVNYCSHYHVSCPTDFLFLFSPMFFLTTFWVEFLPANQEPPVDLLLIHFYL